MAAKTWEMDFRFAAIQASIRKLREADPLNPFDAPVSFCIPVAQRPLVGWTPGRLTMIALVLGFVLLIAGAVLASMAERDRLGIDQSIGMALAACCSISGISMFFVPLKLDRQIIRFLLGERGRQLVERADKSAVMGSELSDPDTRRVKISIDGNDHVLILFDEANRRLLMEGLGARYQIRAEDVEQLAPFEFMNYLGVQLTCRIDETTRLGVAIARPSLLTELVRQLPFLFFLRRFVSNPLFERTSQTLEFPDVDAG